ncbi:MAG: hypothetical protein HIU92_08555 [Proteobacteria bacterium]|nr:hypothetical protein [Pseudomonadota bacterium]
MSQAQTSPSVSQYLNAAYWAYAQAGTPYPDGNTALPTGFSYLLVNGAPLIDYTPGTGFYAAALLTGTGQVMIAFEGTNLYTGNDTFTSAQTIDDAAITAGIVAPSYQTALSFTQTVLTDAAAAGYARSDVYLAGHSLGGADAQFVAAQTGLAGATFGGPGIPSGSIPSGQTASVTDYVERGDPVGNYAQGGNESALLKANNVVHYGTADFIGSYLGTAALAAASFAYEQGQYSLSASLVAAAAAEYHPLETYAADLNVPIASPGLSATNGGAILDTGALGLSLGRNGGIDIAGLSLTTPGAIKVGSQGVTVSAEGQSYTLPLTGTGTTFSLQSDGQGGALLTPGAANSGFVFAGSDGATVHGGASPLVFIGGSGPVSVTGGSGSTTMFGGSGMAVFQGGSGANLLTGGTGASTLIGGMGASTLIGGAGHTVELAAGSAPEMLIAGSGATTIDGATGSGPELLFTGHGSALVALNSAADTLVGGSGASSILGGSAPDVYGFINGHAGGSEVIFGLKPTDILAFGGYGASPITSEGVLGGSDLLTLSDGTTILLQSIDHKVFDGVA